MSRAPKKLIRGQQLAGIPTDDWNAFCELWHQVQHLAARGSGTGATASVTQVVSEVQNTTGDLIDAEFPVLKLSEPVFTYDDNPEAIRDIPQFKGTTPDADTDISDIAIVQGPIADGEFRAAILQGPAHCEIDVTDEAHTHATPKDGDNTKLESGTTGAKIRWKESGTGTKKAVVILRGGGASGHGSAFAVVTEAAGASTHSSSGITYGTAGRCALLDEDGAKVSADSDDEIEFKSVHNVQCDVDRIVELSAPNEITLGSTWDDNKVKGKLVEPTDYLWELPTADEITSVGLPEGSTGPRDYENIGHECGEE